MTARPLRIAIATNGRFHVLDLARELIALGQEVTFYSLLPHARAEKFGLPGSACVSVLPAMAPLLAWERLAGRIAPNLRDSLHARLLDRAIATVLRPCDVFIGMSGLIVAAAERARMRYGARIFVERGSKHINTQAEILTAHGARPPSSDQIARELQSYTIGDRIMIPAAHVAASFDRDPAAAAKLMVNPYGVDVTRFTPRPPRPTGKRTILFVGGWLRRKGVDLLVEAVRRLDDVRLIHVGGRGDYPFPDDARFTHVDPVDQHALVDWYAHADLFVLPSREEGLALVQLQALACGLPVVCSDQTGGRDLAYSPALADRIVEVPVDNIAALTNAIAATLNRNAPPPLSPDDRERLSWRAYAERYLNHIRLDRAAAGLDR